jgi:hypothetical protein
VVKVDHAGKTALARSKEIVGDRRIIVRPNRFNERIIQRLIHELDATSIGGLAHPFPPILLPRLPRPCLCVLCRYRAGILTSYKRAANPSCSLFRAVHCDSISTVPSTPEI